MEQDTVKIVKRTVGLVLLFLVVAGIAGALLWFFGSPWDASGAEKQITAYLQQQYPGQSWEVEKPRYDLSTHGYRAQIRDPLQEDVCFTVLVRKGQVLSDSYEADVTEKGNTVRRLEQEYTALVQERFPKAKIGIHTHNDTGCAVAGAIAAVEEGASQVQGTYLGFGERCGNCNLSTIIGDLQLKLGYQCISPEQLRQLTRMASYVAEITNIALPGGLPYVGRSAFAHKGGMHVDGVYKNSRVWCNGIYK